MMNGASGGASEIACNASEIMPPGRVTLSSSVACRLYQYASARELGNRQAMARPHDSAAARAVGEDAMTSEMFIAFILYEHRAGAHDVPCFFVGVSLGRAEHSLAGRRGGSKALHLIRECTHEPAQ